MAAVTITDESATGRVEDSWQLVGLPTESPRVT